MSGDEGGVLGFRSAEEPLDMPKPESPELASDIANAFNIDLNAARRGIAAMRWWGWTFIKEYDLEELWALIPNDLVAAGESTPENQT